MNAMKLDSFYTPPDAAKRLVDRLDDEPENVADFCAGEGELLRACVERFPAVRCVALDKSKRASSRLLAMNKTWEVHCADFLNERKMSQTGLNNESFDLVVMNPPFSCRGTRYKIDLDGLSFSGSKALLFLARALQYLRIGGVLRAILPTGVVCAERDAEIVGYLKRAYGFRVFAYSSKLSFCCQLLLELYPIKRYGSCIL